MKVDEDLKIKMPGRPSKYTSRVIGKTRAFLKKCIDTNRTPFIEALALEFGVSDRTLYNWAHPKDGIDNEFTEIYEILKTIQKLDLKQKGLLGIYENPVVKMLLSAEHNVVERIKKEVSGEDGDSIKVEHQLSPEDRKTFSDEITQMFEKFYSK